LPQVARKFLLLNLLLNERPLFNFAFVVAQFIAPALGFFFLLPIFALFRHNLCSIPRILRDGISLLLVFLNSHHPRFATLASRAGRARLWHPPQS
jgi:hypothetical protein